MHRPAFLPAAVPKHQPFRSPPQKCDRRSQPTCTLSTHLRDRALADIALLKQLTSNASTYAAATLAAAAIGLTTLGGTPVLAEVPTSAPNTALFDETGLVQKGSAQLFGKAMENIRRDDDVNVRFVLVRQLPYGETPSEYAKELAEEWGLGEKDILFVASTKLARAGVFVGTKAGERIDGATAVSIAEETFGVKAGVESYGGAVLDVSNRLIPVLAGEKDPGPPDLTAREAVQTYKTKKETSKDRNKYVTVVAVVLIISFVAPLLQTYWYVRDD